MAQQPIELILARQLASRLAVPVLLVDANGDTLFFNEPAEAILGTPFDEVDSLSFEERAAFLSPRDLGGQRLAPRDLPGMVAIRERRPSHGIFDISGLDGVRRPVEATGIPLEGAGGHMLGALVIMWTAPAAEAAGHNHAVTSATSGASGMSGPAPAATG